LAYELLYKFSFHPPNMQSIKSAIFFLVTSPMADAKLRTALKNYLASIVEYFHKNGDKKLYDFVFVGLY